MDGDTGESHSAISRMFGAALATEAAVWEEVLDLPWLLIPEAGHSSPLCLQLPAETQVLPFLGLLRSACGRTSAFMSALELRSVFTDLVSPMTCGKYLQPSTGSGYGLIPKALHRNHHYYIERSLGVW